ncbi:protein MHF1-like protein [Senna tora]|uniref:Protein MHF1-like protein n=1 Tax=Senna tora TaxID=362788 RepID=A0A834WX70_9FABA|nr:protein MHF1-like protein [Senna tora]
MAMEGIGGASEVEREGNDSEIQLLRDRFRLSAISIAEAEAKRNGMNASETVVACIADLAFKYTEQLAKDVELFAQHANRKSVNMEDVILSAHRNEHLSTLLRTFSNDLKIKEPQLEERERRLNWLETVSLITVHVGLPSLSLFISFSVQEK